MTKRNRGWVFAAMLTAACVLPLWWSLLTPPPPTRDVKAKSTAEIATPTTQTLFSPPNGGREIRSLSIHPNDNDWLFVECVERIHQRCDVMRYQLTTGRLYRYGLPEGFRYTYAHYSPQGRYIVMSRRKIPGDSEDEERRSLNESEIALMPSEGGVLTIIPAAQGNKLSPFMSLDETRIAFWRSARLVPPGRRVRLLEFDLWEFDLSSGSERPFSGLFKFVEGGQAQYVSDDEILLQSYGPSGLFADYHDRYGGSEIYRMRRGDDKVPVPCAFDGISHAELPSQDRAGHLCLQGQTRRHGLSVIRLSSQGVRQGWQLMPADSGPIFEPRELLCAPGGGYIATIYMDQPSTRGNRLGGMAMLDIATTTWSAIQLPSWADAEIIPVTVSSRLGNNEVKP